MKKIIENRAIAAVCLLLCILAALTLGTRRSAKAMESDVLEAFRSSPEQYVTVKSAMQDVSIAAHNLIDAAESLVGENAVADFRNLTAEFDKHKADPFGTVTPGDLGTAAKALYDKLNGADTPKNDAKYYYNQLKSTVQQLARNEAYGDAAKAYNEKIGKFPISLFSLSLAILFD